MDTTLIDFATKMEQAGWEQTKAGDWKRGNVTVWHGATFDYFVRCHTLPPWVRSQRIQVQVKR